MMVSRSFWSMSVLLLVTIDWQSAVCQDGVILTLRGVQYPNRSTINIREIGENDEALICQTDRRPCCRGSNRAGEWYYPNGSLLTIEGLGRDLYRNRGDEGEVRLNRRNNALYPIGTYHCEVPDKNNTNRKVLVTLYNYVSENMSDSTTTTFTTVMEDKGLEEEQKEMEDRSSSTGATVGAVVSIVILFTVMVIFIVVILYLIRRKKRKTNTQSDQHIPQMHNISYSEVQNNKSQVEIEQNQGVYRTETPQINTFPCDMCVTEGKGVYFKIEVSGVPQPTAIWYHNGEPVKADYAREIEEDGSLAIPSTELKHSGVYKAVVANQHGSEEREVKLTVDKEGRSLEYAATDEIVSTRPIPIPEFGEYVSKLYANSNQPFKDLYQKHSGEYTAVVTNQYGSEEREVKLTVNKGGESLGYAATDEIVSTRPIPIPEFGEYVSKLHANSNQPFKDLYQSLDSGGNNHKTSYATHPDRKILNRFGNIVVYDDNRITLEPIPEADDCYGDYINACYIHGYSTPDKFIATQGPLPSTVVDFWRLIWQERPSTIVMVTNIKEESRIKCEQYWPDSGKEQIGPFQVTITDQQVFVDYTIRTLSVSLDTSKHSHTLTQYHFTAWPDHGVPDNATSVLASTEE